NQRARVKVYGLVIVCQNIRAVKLLVVPGYDTYSFLLTFSRFTSNYGNPALVVSDRGTQLLKASKTVESVREGGGGLQGDCQQALCAPGSPTLPPEGATQGGVRSWDWSAISERAAKSGTKWIFVEAGSQWRNGLVERQVGVLKKSMASVLDTHSDLTYPELEALFDSAANLVNQRPLAVRTFSQDDFCSITPNDLLLGRNRLPLGSISAFGDNDNLTRRMEEIKQMEENWWSLWIKQ
ncbi:MAG: hypothetical protein GY782_07870, partial [Gammaproteobacteria bacterium]|nr:hypothetical protein [Gammaproteobacteria bacterium]